MTNFGSSPPSGISDYTIGSSSALTGIITDVRTYSCPEEDLNLHTVAGTSRVLKNGNFH